MSAKLRLHAIPATLAFLALTLGLAVALLAPGATATFGGKNGRIAFVSTPLADEGKFEIYTMRAIGGDARRLTHNAAFDSGPTFSPDGKRIGFVSHRDGNYEIYVMNLNGSGVTRLTDNPADDFSADWQP
jgi:Tol biopolymer transport system component